MADFSQIMGSIGGGASSVATWVLIIVAVIVGILLLAGGIFLWWFTKKRYNLRAEIKMVRSDGKIVIGEWGKAMFNSKKGVLYLKRQRMRAIPMKVMDVRRYLQGSDLITVLQLSPTDYRPVINDSWTESIIEYEDEKGNVVEQKESILNIKADTGVNKAWDSAFEVSSKKAYSLASFLTQYAVPLSIAMVLIAVFVGFAIIWTRLPTVCR